MAAFFGAFFGLVLIAVIFVVGVIACTALIVKGFKRLFGNKE